MMEHGLLMTLIIIIFGILILLAGLVILVNPVKFFGWFDQHVEKPGLHILAVSTRLILGVILILQSGVSRYPHVVEVLGWIAIIAAISLAIIGRDRFKRLMSWALTLAKPVGRVAGVAAACFGAFLIYAFI